MENFSTSFAGYRGLFVSDHSEKRAQLTNKPPSVDEGEMRNNAEE